MLSNLNNLHSLEVVDRVSETQLQVGENSDCHIILSLITMGQRLVLTSIHILYLI